MRDKSHQRDANNHKPPSNITAEGMDAWYAQQKQREKELRQRRQEAEALLRGYRGGRESMGVSRDSSFRDEDQHNQNNMNVRTTGFVNDSVPLRSASSHLSETLDDPRSFHTRQQQQQYSDEKKSETGDVPPQATASSISEEVTVWLDFISAEPGAKFPPAANRYHLYLSYACPGSHRALIVLALKGLQDTISVTYVHPTWRLTNPDDESDKHRGWVFGDPNGMPFSNTIARGGPFPPAYSNNEADPLFAAFSIRNIYEQAGDTSGKYTIPVLWDTFHNTIVNNESSDIAYMLNSCFNDYARNPDLDLYTEYNEEGVVKLNEVSEWLSPLMIHGVYRCGFAKNQRAYDRAIAELCEAFDHADDILQKQRYLTGNDTITDADIRLFVSLIRFDEVYAVYFKANARLVMLTPSLLNFCREIYQIPGVAETCDMEQIKAHFYGSHAEWNKYSVIPRGLGFMELLDMPHDRHLLVGEEENDDNEI